jgi:energy-coupling factor transporter ATP-binding protein EcfA2
MQHDDAYRLTWTNEAGNGRIAGGTNYHIFRRDFHARALFRSLFSQVQVNFSVGEINTITSSRLDDLDKAASRTSPNLGREIAQLLIDIRAADAEDLQRWVEQHPNQVPPLEMQSVRLTRFTKAFEVMFPTKRFKRVDRISPNRIEVIFEEFGRESTLDQLSTGEKQIVFRAGFILRDIARAISSIVLIDEPELSLHPEWQARILQFYNSLLSPSDGRHGQIFVATHSPFIVHQAANAKIFILEKDAAGAIGIMPDPHYPTVGSSVAVRAFNIDSFLASAHYEILILVEGESDVSILNTAWDKLYPNARRFFEVRAAIGAKNINVTLNHEPVFERAGNRKIVGLFDFDAAYDWWRGVWKGSRTEVVTDPTQGLMAKHVSRLGWVMLLPVPTHRGSYASSQLAGNSVLSIEFLFNDGDIPPNWIGTEPLPLGAQRPYFMPRQKSALAEHVKQLSSVSFAAFQPIFERLRDIERGRL